MINKEYQACLFFVYFITKFYMAYYKCTHTFNRKPCTDPCVDTRIVIGQSHCGVSQSQQV